MQKKYLKKFQKHMKNGLTLKVDTSKIGIDAVFRPWQYEAVNLLFEANEEHSSNEMHMRLRSRGFDISRASVINFLYGLSDQGLATRREESAKGGYKGIYQITDSRFDFNDKIIKKICVTLHEAFPGHEWLKEIWEEERG